MQSPELSLTTRQQLSVSPRLQQAVRLLQLSAVEFEREFAQALTTNPFLEEGERAERDPARPEADAPSALPESPVQENFSMSSTSSTSGSTGSSDVGDWAAARLTLRDQLREQVHGLRITERQRIAAEAVIESLDDDGFLRQDAEEAAATLGLDEPLTSAEVSEGIVAVQALEPTGIGARSLSECLELQLLALPEETPARDIALVVVRGHLDEMAKRQYAMLRQAAHCDEAQLQEAFALIRSLNPRPGDSLNANEAQPVVPEIIVHVHRGKVWTSINPAVLPRGRLNRQYVDLFRQVRGGGHSEMRQQLREAKWLLRNVQQRYSTIKRVADAIVSRQKAFFAYGDIALRPLVLRQIADELQLHESTVSRATGNKYMATPRGLFEFKHFFSRELATETGGACSASAVRAIMRELIDSEHPADPLSDVVLAKCLRDRGIDVARRTVAKYRNLMRLPPADLRKQAYAA